MFCNNRFRQSGQSLPLIAVMLVVIIGLVGLSVDVGNAYGQQRRIQNVTNAGAMAGMNSVVRNASNGDVCTSVQRTLAANRVATNAPEYTYRVDYVFANDDVVMLCEWNGSKMIPNAQVLPIGDRRPANIKRLQVTMTETVGTYFARLAGRKDLTVNANGNACLGGYGPGTYPLGVPITLKKTETLNGGQGTQTYHRIIKSNGIELSTSHPDWGKWDAMMGMTIYLPVSNDDDMSGTHISWLDWTGGSSGTNQLDAAMTFPGTLQDSFNEADPRDPALPNTLPLKELSLGDWISGSTGVRASLSDDMNNLMKPDGTGQARDMILPMYDVAGGSGSNGAFHIAQTGYFQFVGFDMSSPYGAAPPAGIPNNQKYIMLRYMGKASGSPEECASEKPDSASSPKRFTVQGQTKVTLVDSVNAANISYDILLVMDVSTSMKLDWNDKDTGAANARAEDAKRALLNFARGYNVQNDPEARLAYVTFGGSGTNAIVTEQGWATACAAPSTDCGNDDNKWKPVQTKITNMTHRGGTPGAMAFERVEELLRNKRTPPPGKQYGQVVVFATDGIFNVCGSEVGQQSCPWGTKVGGVVAQNLISGRPIWQAQQVAERIKSTTGAKIFMVTLVPNCSSPSPDEDCFTTTGLPEMSSGTGYYYSANNGAAVDNIYTTIRSRMATDSCWPMEKLELATGASIVLSQPNNPTFNRSTTVDTNGDWNFKNLEAGQYVVRVNPAYSVKSPLDKLWRKYTRLRNGLNLNEETQASISINPQYPNGATVYSDVRLSLPLGTDEAPLNGCNSGTNTP